MMKNLLWGFLVTAFSVSCGTASTTEKETATEDSTIEDSTGADDYIIVPGQRVGRITKANATKEAIKQAYGAENVQEDSVYIGEGFFWNGLKVFPGTTNELEIAWDPEAAIDLPAFLRIEQEGTDWRTNQNITIGTTLEELIKINGKDFRFLGFGWDYGGFVSNLDGGNISNNLSIRLESMGEVNESLLGDQEVATDNPAVEGAGIQVVRLETSFQ